MLASSPGGHVSQVVKRCFGKVFRLDKMWELATRGSVGALGWTGQRGRRQKENQQEEECGEEKSGQKEGGPSDHSNHASKVRGSFVSLEEGCTTVHHGSLLARSGFTELQGKPRERQKGNQCCEMQEKTNFGNLRENYLFSF